MTSSPPALQHRWALKIPLSGPFTNPTTAIRVLAAQQDRPFNLKWTPDPQTVKDERGQLVTPTQGYVLAARLYALPPDTSRMTSRRFLFTIANADHERFASYLQALASGEGDEGPAVVPEAWTCLDTARMRDPPARPVWTSASNPREAHSPSVMLWFHRVMSGEIRDSQAGEPPCVLLKGFLRGGGGADHRVVVDLGLKYYDVQAEDQARLGWKVREIFSPDSFHERDIVEEGARGSYSSEEEQESLG